MEVIVGFVAFLTLFYGPVFLYYKLDWFKGFYHGIMGWHMQNKNKGITRDEVNTCAVCKHCGEKIIQDSQGNWFTYDGGEEA